MADYLRPYGQRTAFAQRTPNGFELLYPRLAVSANMGMGAAAWTFGSYTVLTASAVADFNPCTAHFYYMCRPVLINIFSFQVEVEIATGPAGAEALYGRFGMSFVVEVGVADVGLKLATGVSFPLGPTTIPAGTRIVARARKSRANADVVSTGTRLYIAGYDGAPPRSDTTYGLDAYLGGAPGSDSQLTPVGATLSVPSAAYPTYGAWTQVWASAPRDAFVWGNVYDDQSGGLNGGTHVQFGIGAAGQEVAYAQIGNPAHSGLGAGVQKLRRPLLVLAGERLAVRQAGANATNMQILYEDL